MTTATKIPVIDGANYLQVQEALRAAAKTGKITRIGKMTYAARQTLNYTLGNELIASGEAMKRVLRYSIREPHEEPASKQQRVSFYVCLDHTEGSPSVRCFIGPRGGISLNDID